MELNITNFNNILLKHCKDDKSKIELLKKELEAACSIIWDEMAVLLQELADTNYNSKQFEIIKNIKDNTEHIIEQLEELEAKQEHHKPAKIDPFWDNLGRKET